MLRGLGGDRFTEPFAFLGDPISLAVVFSDCGDSESEGVRVFERMNSLIVIPAKVANVFICRCCSGSISMVSLLMPFKLTILSTSPEWCVSGALESVGYR